MALIPTFRPACVLLALLVLVPIGNAQDTAGEKDAAATELPDPMTLTPSWWNFFAKAGDARERRIKEFQASLEALAATLSGDSAQEVKARSALEELAHFADRYQEVLSREPPATQPNPATKTGYSIVELIELSRQARESGFEATLEREEIERIVRSLARADKNLADAKAKYFALPEAAPQRLLAGIEIMRARFLNAINAADLEHRRARAELVTRRSAFLDEALQYAKRNLAVGDTNAAEWAERAKTADALRQRLEAEASSARLRLSGFGGSTKDRAERRRLEQHLIGFEVHVASAALTSAQATLAERLAEHVHAPSDARLAGVRGERDTLKTLLGGTAEALEGWRRATERERIAALAQLADVGGMDAQLAELHRSRVARADESSQQINQLERQLADAQTLVEAAGAYIVEEGGVTADLWSRTMQGLEQAWGWTTTWGSRGLFSLDETPVTAAGLLRVAIILTVAWWVSRLLRRVLERVMQSRDTMNRASIYTLQRVSHYLILVIALMIALSSIGIDFTKLALFVSALGVGLGFGLQAIFSNFVAGLIILFEKSLKVGDFVELESGVHGEVREINIRGTLITTNDNIDILVPNSEFVSGRVTNWTLREAYRRLRVPFGVAYGTSKELVEKAGLEAADEVPYTLKVVAARQPQVWLVGFGDSSLDFELVVWLTQEAVKRPGTVAAAYNWAIESALARHGIEIPFPQRDLHLRSFFGHMDAHGLETVRSLNSAKVDSLPAAGT